MRPKSVTVTSSNSPYYIPVDYMMGDIGVTATPSGAGDYDVAYTHENALLIGAANIADSDWTDITDMSAATTAQSKVVGPNTCLRVTLNSGTSVKVAVVQRDV